MLEKLKSRKLWAAVGTAVITLVLQELGVAEEYIDNAVKLAQTYILGQGAVDVAQAIKGGTDDSQGDPKRTD